MEARTGCWTCKKRKVSCDRAAPVCLNCSRSKRKCGGYGLRLSWPRLNDRKRAIVGHASHIHSNISSQHMEIQWINASSVDIYLHHVASERLNSLALAKRRPDLIEIPPHCIDQLTYLKPSKINVSEQELLHYFETTASKIVPMLDSGRRRVCQILMRIARSNSGPASTAVLQSMLALASLYRDGLQPQAARLKLAALQVLMTSAVTGIDAESGIEHIAAGILLSCFEMQLNFNGDTWNSQWVGHVCGAKVVIKAVKSGHYPHGSDASVILGWVYYYDVLVRFSLRHWRTTMASNIVPALGFSSNGDAVCDVQYVLARTSFARMVPQISEHAHEILRLLSEVCDTVLDPWDSRYQAVEYQEYLRGLEGRLVDASITTTNAAAAAAAGLPSPSPSTDVESDTDAVEESEPEPDLTSVLKLFQLSALIYLDRISKNFSGQSPRLSSWIDSAFSILRNLQHACSSTFRYPFPLFIIGCEARTDDRRRVILDLISSAQRDPHVRTMKEVAELIQASWVQDDLQVLVDGGDGGGGGGGELDYIRKMNLVISAYGAVPILA